MFMREERGNLMMKRLLTILAASIALTAVLCGSASASSFDSAAKELAAIGMLKGSAGDLALDKAPTRTQAAIMLVRLFGAEKEAIDAYAAGTLTCPFTDVNETAAPFAAWLADKGLASGTSANTFSASSPCTARAYTIFLLRALGYRDGEDFTAADAQEFAMTLGLLDTSAFTGKFLRDDMAALTYQALGTDLKDGGTYLLDSLIQSGAIDAGAAKPIVEKIEAYRAMQASGAELASGVDAGVTASMVASVQVSGQNDGDAFDMSQSQTGTVSGSAKILPGGTPQMAFDLDVNANGESRKVELWMKEGVLYVRSGEEAYQMPAEEGAKDISAILANQAGNRSGAALLPFLDGVAVRTSRSGVTTYTAKLNSAFTGLMGGVLDAAFRELPDELEMDAKLSLRDSAITYTLNKDGSLRRAGLALTVKADMNAGAGDYGSMKISVTMTMDMDMEIKAAGENVKISFPDFSGFERAA